MGLSKLYIKTILFVVIYYGENETIVEIIVTMIKFVFYRLLPTLMARRTTARGERSQKVSTGD